MNVTHSSLYIFDLDGTLSLTNHRQHILNNTKDPDRWKKFFEACVDDKPNWSVINTFKKLNTVSDCIIWSGRSEDVRPQTERWLFGHLGYVPFLRMRRSKDFTPDDELKQLWLKSLSDEERNRLVAAFDDRNKVVKMWRKNKVACYQVAEGNF